MKKGDYEIDNPYYEESDHFLKHKYSLGESVFILHENKVREARISQMKIVERSDRWNTGSIRDVKYRLDIPHSYTDHGPTRVLRTRRWIDENEIYKTKDRLTLSAWGTVDIPSFVAKTA